MTMTRSLDDRLIQSAAATMRQSLGQARRFSEVTDAARRNGAE